MFVPMSTVSKKDAVPLLPTSTIRFGLTVGVRVGRFVMMGVRVIVGLR